MSDAIGSRANDRTHFYPLISIENVPSVIIVCNIFGTVLENSQGIIKAEIKTIRCIEHRIIMGATQIIMGATQTVVE